jgi:hypothetical protein
MYVIAVMFRDVRCRDVFGVKYSRKIVAENAANLLNLK